MRSRLINTQTRTAGAQHEVVQPKAGKYNRRSGSWSESNQSMVDDRGNLNFSSKDEAVDFITRIASQIAQGNLRVNTTHLDEPSGDSIAVELERASQELREAASDPAKWAVFGEDLNTALIEVGNREGFTRSVLGYAQINSGEEIPLPVTHKFGVAHVATSSTEISAVHVRSRYIRPPCWYLQANILTDRREIVRSPVGLMEQMLNQGLEATMTEKDRLLKMFADRMIGITNPPVAIVSALTPQLWADLRDSIAKTAATPAITAIMDVDYWRDITASAAFSASFDPVTQYEVILEGRLGQYQGVSIITDGFREKELRVLDDGDIYMFGPPPYIGVDIDYEEMVPVVVDQRSQGRPILGYYISQLHGMVVFGHRAITKGSLI